MANAEVTGNTRLTKLRGFNAISLNENDNLSGIVIYAGSRYEVGGYFFTVTRDTPVVYASTGRAYVYATTSGTFVILSNDPTWNDDKQGYYFGASRAIAWAYYTTKGHCTGKCPLLPFTRIQRLRFGFYHVPNSGPASGRALILVSSNSVLEMASKKQVTAVRVMINNDAGTNQKTSMVGPVGTSAATGLLGYWSPVNLTYIVTPGTLNYLFVDSNENIAPSTSHYFALLTYETGTPSYTGYTSADAIRGIVEFEVIL